MSTEHQENTVHEPLRVYKTISDERTTYNIETGTWMRISGYNYEHLVDNLARQPQRAITTIEKPNPVCAKNWRFEKLTLEEISKLEQDVIRQKLKFAGLTSHPVILP